jgi:cell division septum initiation protein DivIVA
MDVRKLTAKLQKRQLQQQLDALDAEAAQKEQPPPPPPAAQPGRFGVRAPDITDATLERLSADAARIVREVQAGAIPTGVRQPFHAFAGCLYLRAQLDGKDTREAAWVARGELISHMLDDADFSPSQIRAFAKEYEALKRQLREQNEQNRGQSLLASLHNLGVPTIPKNGNGNGAA